MWCWLGMGCLVTGCSVERHRLSCVDVVRVQDVLESLSFVHACCESMGRAMI